MGRQTKDILKLSFEFFKSDNAYMNRYLVFDGDKFCSEIIAAEKSDLKLKEKLLQCIFYNCTEKHCVVLL